MQLKMETILLFIIMMSLIKLLPIYLIYRKKEMRLQMKDILFTMFLFSLFLLWVYIHNREVIHEEWDSLLHEKNETPIMYLYTRVKNRMKEYLRRKDEHPSLESKDIFTM